MVRCKPHRPCPALQVCDCVSELAAGIIEDQGWPELLPFIFQCVQSGACVNNWVARCWSGADCLCLRTAACAYLGSPAFGVVVCAGRVVLAAALPFLLPRCRRLWLLLDR